MKSARDFFLLKKHLLKKQLTSDPVDVEYFLKSSLFKILSPCDISSSIKRKDRLFGFGFHSAAFSRLIVGKLFADSNSEFLEAAK